MLQIGDEEINEYQLKKINQWSDNDILSFKTLYANKFSRNPKEAKECLNAIYEYRLSFNQSKDLNLSTIHKNGINEFFSGSKRKRTIEELISNHNELVAQMKLDNYNNSKDREIINRINKIKNLYKDYLNKEITKENIPENLKSSEDDLISIVMSNLQKVANITFKDSQIYSLIILLGKNKLQGRIIQVFSGEGKTLIIQSLAAILVLQGHKVDILVQEKTNAKNDAKEASKILEKLKITVTHNVKIEDDCYQKDIVYGTLVNFQGSIMRDGHQLNGERQNRGFDILLLDEIEDMFLDDFSQTTHLVSNKPFYESYSIYLLILWGYYKNLHLNNFDVRDNKELQEKVKQYLNDKLKNFIKIKDDKSDFFFPMSSLLKDFALSQSINFVDSLISSLSQRKNVEYAVKDGQILKVDLLDTGTIQKDKPFENGLQQFLEIQNELSVTQISTNTSNNYLSNYGFFKKYQNENINSIYGVTGAFGSVKSRELIEKLYGLDFDYIPTDNVFLLKELTSNISKNHDTWAENILLVVKREVNNGRSVLLLCETVGSCEELYEKISLSFPRYKLYKIIGEEDEKKIPKTIAKNTVIISTDMSGRRHKFDIDKEVLKNGGMHIIFSFISNNSRKEEKNYKNAGKAGEPGSYQFILDFEDTMNKYYSNYNIENNYEYYKDLINKKEKTSEDFKKLDEYSFEFIKTMRENNVNDRCNKALEKIINTEKSDYLFNLYCTMLLERKELKETENKYDLNSIDERWGMFLKTIDVDNKTLNEIETKFQDFKNEIYKELDKKIAIKNPGYYNQYINEKLSSVFFYFRNKNIIFESNQENFQKAKTYFSKNPEQKFEFDDYIKKCDMAIELDNYSFIPYYLKGICKLISGKENGIEDLEKSLTLINNEIKRYLYYFGLLISLDINIDLLFYQINILNSIKINVIQKNIEFYYENKETIKEFRIYRKLLKNCFLYNADKLDEEEENDEESLNVETKDKKFLKSIKQYYLNNETNGLKFLFFLKEPNAFSFESLISSGIIMISLSISGFSYLDNKINEEIFNLVGNILEIDLNYKEYQEWIKQKHEKEFPFSEDKSLIDFIEKNNIKIKNTNKDLIDIMKKYDKDYLNKINKEFGKTFKILFKKKIEKLNLKNYKNYISNKNEENNDEKYIQSALNNIKDLNENKKKIILANNLMRRDGRDWLTDDTREGKDINERLEKASNELSPITNEIIIRELKVSMIKEADKQKALKEEQDEKLSKQKEILSEAKIKVNKMNEEYKSKQKLYNEKREKNNNDIDELNKMVEEYNQDNSKHDSQKIDNFRADIKKVQEELKKESDELNKEFENIEKENSIKNKELECHNNIVEQYNKFNSLQNERIELHNNLNQFIKIDFSKNDLKIIFTNNNNMELPQFEKDLKQIESDANLAYKDELKKIGKKIINEEEEKIIIEKRIEFVKDLLRVIKENSNFWNNCFNKSLSSVNYNFNTNDMKKIISNHISELNKNKRNKNEYYYIKDMENEKYIRKAETKLNKENKIIIGNVYKDNEVWDSYCIVPLNNSKYFLYKSNDGSKPDKNIVNKIQELTGGCIPKINVSNSENQKNEKEFSDVNAIENNKIIINQIEQDKNKFVDNFESFGNFYNESRENKLNKKKKEYPEEFIRGLYKEISLRNNTQRISVVLFAKYFLNENKDNEIDLEFLKKLYDILMNFNDIRNEEKDILRKEYNNIIEVYNQVYHVIKQKEEEEQEEIEQIIKKKHRRNIKNTKVSQNDIKPNENEINRNQIKPELNNIEEKLPENNNIQKPSNNEEKSFNRNKENINTNKEENSKKSLNSNTNLNNNILNINSRNKNNNKHTMKDEGEIEIYNLSNMKQQTHNQLLNDNPNSKRALNDEEKNQKEEILYNRNNIDINQFLQGAEIKEENNETKRDNNENNKGNKEQTCCEKTGCLIF